MTEEKFYNLLEVRKKFPDDESIIISTNKGEPAILDSRSNAGKAYKNIAQRILGNNIPIMEVEQENNFFGKIKKMFGVAK